MTSEARAPGRVLLSRDTLRRAARRRGAREGEALALIVWMFVVSKLEPVCLNSVGLARTLRSDCTILPQRAPWVKRVELHGEIALGNPRMPAPLGGG